MKRRGVVLVSLRWFALVLLTVQGCAPSLRETMQRVFEEEPIMAIEYQPVENLTIFKTRNILLNAGYEANTVTSLVTQMVLLAEGVPPETPVVQAGVLRFRSLGLQPRFHDNRALSLVIAGYRFDLGPLTIDNVAQREGRAVEDLSIGVPGQLIIAIAGADTVSGMLGPVSFEMTAEALKPVRAMVDSVAAMQRGEKEGE